MRIYIVRHGIAHDRMAADCPPDPDRALTDKGIHRTREAAKGLQALGAAPTAMLTSPYLRARETAEITAKMLGFALDRIETTEILLPCEDPVVLLKELARRDESEVMCFGHAPNVDDVIGCALGLRAPVTSLKKAAAACIDVFAWSPPQGLLQWVCQPAALRQLGAAR